MSRQPYRLPKGGRIDRARDAPLHLRRPHASPAIPAIRWPRRCSPMASTWWRARSSIIARAAFSRAGSEDPAALVADRRRSPRRTDPNTRVTEQEIYDGPDGAPAELLADAEVRCRRGRTICIAPFIPAGFYYKTFKGGRGWMCFEPLIRRAAGLGRAPARPIPTATRR